MCKSISPSIILKKQLTVELGFIKDIDIIGIICLVLTFLHCKKFTKGKVVKNLAPPAFTGQQILDQLNALEPDPERPGYFKGYNSKHAWTHKPCC